MNNLQSIKHTLLPYLKGAPIIIILVIVAFAATNKALNYVVPKYESTAKLRLENSSDGMVGSLDLYENFNVFSVSNKIKTEVEVLLSGNILGRVVDKIDMPVRYYRIGEFRTSEMYNESPFVISEYEFDQHMLGKDIMVKFVSDSVFNIVYDAKNYSGKIGETLETPSASLQIDINKDIVGLKGIEVLTGDFYFRILSRQERISLLKGSINVSSIDKDIPIVRISCKDHVAERTALVVNTLSECYIEDYVGEKAKAAEKTYNFISEQLEEVASKLRESELAIETYKKENKVVNTRQETETVLKEVSQLHIILITMEMEQDAMDSVLVSLVNEDIYSPISVNFEAFSDLTFTGIISDINTQISERKRLLIRYNENNENVVYIENQIVALKQYLREGIEKSKQANKVKTKNLVQQIAYLEKQFEDLPEREKNLVILEREFTLNQKIYNFLSEKQVESSIAQAATIAFHRIIQRGLVPKTPVSPNKKFLSIIAAFLVIMTCLLVIYIKTNFASNTHSRFEVEKSSALPVIGIIPKIRKHSNDWRRPFESLVREILVQKKISKHQLIAVSSASKREGKSFVVEHSASVFALLGWKTLVVDFNFCNQTLSQPYASEIENETLESTLSLDTILSQVIDTEENLSILPFRENGLGHISLQDPDHLANMLEMLKERYDVVIVDTPAHTITNLAVLMIKHADFVIQIIRTGKTPTHMIQQADMMAYTYGLENINLLVNATPKVYNYNGTLTGSRYSYLYKKGFRASVQRYLNTYLRWKH